jgi:serine protease AprX
MACTFAIRPPTGRGITWGRQRSAALFLAAAVAVLPAAPAVMRAAAHAEGSSSVIVIKAAGAAGARAEAAVRAAGGTVERELGIIHGFSARVPASSVPALNHAPGVASVSPDRAVRPESGTYSPTTDQGSLYNVTKATGAQQYWGAGYTGAGVGVALIDTGVVPVDGLTSSGKVVNGPDLSWESQNPSFTYLDTYGHGTHMAGIIAGRANAAVPGSYVNDSTDFVGMAPDARLVNVKVADSHGTTDVSQVIAAIDWVVQHRNDNGLNIRVINLSYGTDGPQNYTVDPLAYAAEQAWNAGIFVAAAAGNGGSNPQTSSLLDPAYDPNIMAVGAADTTVTPATVAAFSSTGNADRSPDMVAPGAHVVSLRNPGSYIDQTYASTGAVTSSLFRGSGTSQATAVMSGAAALVIQQRPTITPSQLKALLGASATPLQGMTPQQQGHGELDLSKALTASVPATPTASPSSGTGSLEASRGSEHPVRNGVALAGERDVFGHAFSSAGSTWSGGAWNGSTWSGGAWNGSTWSGSTWSGSTWSGSTWSGSTWSSCGWNGSTWSGSTWSGSTWSSCAWNGSTWSGSTWSGSTWSGSTWSGSTWSGSTWSGSTWSDYAWADASWS